jgi:hypothetical protein
MTSFALLVVLLSVLLGILPQPGVGGAREART